MPALPVTEEHHQHVYGTFEHKLYRQISLPISIVYELTYYLPTVYVEHSKNIDTHYYSHFLSKNNLHVIDISLSI